MNAGLLPGRLDTGSIYLKAAISSCCRNMAQKGTEKSLRLLRDGRMVHKEKYCAYWHCERNGGTTCWDWGNKWAGMICPNDERCEKYRVCANCNGVMGKCQTYKKVKRGEL